MKRMLINATQKEELRVALMGSVYLIWILNRQVMNKRNQTFIKGKLLVLSQALKPHLWTMVQSVTVFYH